MIKAETIKTGIYMRVSTEEQAKEGFSINAQKEKLTNYSEISDWAISDYYIENGVSAKNIKDRPEINRLIEDIKTGKINNVLIYKLDRLTRSVKDLISLIELFEEYDCTVSSLTEKLETGNAVGRMFVKIIGIFAEFERENLAERVSFGYEQKTREGNYTNTQGVNGYDYIIGKGDLVVNEEEKQIVNRIYEMYLNGTSMLKIAKTFNDEKVPSKRGGFWGQSTIKSILTNPLYVGKIRYGVTKKLESRAFEVEGVQETIIDEDTFIRVQELISKRKKYNSKKYPSENAYFSTALRCAKCGARFYPKQQKQKGKYYITYYCNNRQSSKCNCSGISHTKILNEFEEYISNYKLDGTIEIKSTIDNTEQINKLLLKLETLERKRKRIQQLFIDEQLSNSDFQEITNQIKNNKIAINNNFESLKDKKEEINLDSIKDIIIDLRKNWDNLDTSLRNSFVNQFIKFITLDINDGQANIKEIQFI